MRWRRTVPVQHVGAMIVTGASGVERLVDAMRKKSPLLRSLPVEHGRDWAALFAAPLGGEDPVLPRLEGATALYETAPGCWLPVGVALDAPDHALPALWRSICDHYIVEPPLILVPRLSGAGADSRAAGDVYLVRDPAPFDQSSLGGPRSAETYL